MKSGQRDVSLDYLRGLAVIFMVMQHLAVWLWDAGWSKSADIFWQAPVYQMLIALSALSAPVFLYCAGCSACFFLSVRGKRSAIVRRGLFLVILGYITVLTIPSWFAPGSWYVLQCIGFCMITAPFLQALQYKRLPMIWCVVVIVGVCGQYLLQTPLSYSNIRMADMTLACAPLRLALFEGHFPVFPWWSFFVMGYWSADYVKEERYHTLLYPAFLLGISAIILVLAGELFPFLRAEGIGRYIFSWRLRFYPLLLPVLLFIASASLFAFCLVRRVTHICGITQRNPVTAIGRLALTAFATHIYIKQFVFSYGYVRSLTKWETIGVTVLLLSVYAVLSRILSRRNYRYSLEWLLRRVG